MSAQERLRLVCTAEQRARWQKIADREYSSISRVAARLLDQEALKLQCHHWRLTAGETCPGCQRTMNKHGWLL